MARRMKRSIGFAGTAEEHKASSNKFLKQAGNGFNRAAAVAEAGNCRLAYAALKEAEFFIGKADAQAEYVREDERLFKFADEAEKQADSAFYKHCLVGKGLSGLGAHRRRKSRR